MKISKVCPIHKGGPESDFGNYRPISVLPSFSKIFEKLIHKRLSDYLEKLNILTQSQYGFRAHHSTAMALLDFYDNVDAIDNKKYSIGIFVDLQKAFDTIDHGILLNKLYYYGIRGVPLKWFQNYLHDRKQFVTLNGVASDYLPVHCGVPQGSILGPLLFLIYVNDIVNCSNLLHFIIFADDTNMLFSANNLEDLITIVNTELHKLSIWFKANKMSLNLKKTNFILFGNKLIDISTCTARIQIDGCQIDQVTKIKFLGVIIDEKLNWKYHISQLSSTLSRNIGIINKIRNKLPYDALVTLYDSMVLSHLNYCCIVWGSTYHSNLETILKLQKKSLRIITKSSYRAHSEPLFYKLNKLNIFDICKLQTAVFVFNSLQCSPATQVFYSRFKFTSLMKQYDTRTTNRLVVPFCRTDIRKNSIACSGPLIWNSLPEYVIKSPSVASFKKQYKNLLLSQYCHSD